MLSDFHYFGVALLFALISAVVTFVVGSRNLTAAAAELQQDRAKIYLLQCLLRLSAAIFVFDILLQRSVLYYLCPTFAGSFFGYSVPLFFALVPALVAANIFTVGRSKAITALIVVGFFAVPIVQTSWQTFGPQNSKRFADLAHVTYAKAGETLPPTDEQHLVQVTQTMAVQKASNVLSTKSGYSSSYAIGDLTLQSIRGHRYYAAPLVPLNSNDTFWTPLFGGRATSPGYVLVDAENKEATPELHDGFHISLFVGQDWSMNLERFVYQAGYDQGKLDNATFEVDDNLQPHWTITYLTPAFGDITGRKVDKVIVVDVANATPVLHAYNPGAPAIKWVDRVISADLASTYAHDWGIYGQAYTQSSFGNWFDVAFHISNQGTMVPAETEELMLSYTKDDHNVFVVPMTSQNNSDQAVLGVLVFETDRNQAKFYPDLKGFSHSASVSATMAGVAANLQKYDVENLELYNIYGHLTWVALYTRSQTVGSTFGAIGFMDAFNQDLTGIAYGTDLETALSDYASKMGRGNGGRVANGANDKVVLDGKIWRIGAKGNAFRFQLVGDATHYFDVNTQTYQGSPLLRDGDHISGLYADTHQSFASVISLKLVGDGPGTAQK